MFVRDGLFCAIVRLFASQRQQRLTSPCTQSLIRELNLISQGQETYLELILGGNYGRLVKLIVPADLVFLHRVSWKASRASFVPP